MDLPDVVVAFASRRPYIHGRTDHLSTGDPRDAHRPHCVAMRHPPGGQAAPPRERTAATLALIACGGDRDVAGPSLLRGFLDRHTSDDDVFPAGCNRGAMVRRLLHVLPKLFWARRVECGLREFCENGGGMHRMAVWWERDDSVAMLNLASRHLDEGVKNDAALLALLAKRAQFYEYQYSLGAAAATQPWWKLVVDVHLQTNDVLRPSFERVVDQEAVLSRLPPALVEFAKKWMGHEGTLLTRRRVHRTRG